MQNRRHEPRVKAFNLVHVEESKAPLPRGYKTEDAIGRTADLSHDGMNLKLDHCLRLRTQVKLDLALGNLVLELKGKVRSVRALGDHTCEHGIEFFDLTSEQYEALDEHLQLRAVD